MPLRRTQVDELFRELIQDIRSGAEKCASFLEKLDQDNDWAYLIKVQALIEASITEAIIARLGDERIRRLVERLPLADTEIGKIALAKDLDLLDSSQRKFVRRLASLRNNLAHRVDHVDFTFATYLSGLNAPQVDEWRRTIPWFPAKPEDSRSWGEYAFKHPRSAIWMSTYILAAMLQVSATESRTIRQTREMALKTAEELYMATAAAKSGG
jgi:hypothetical protein